MATTEKEPYITYKINTKFTYKVYRQEANGRLFYKVQVKKKNYNSEPTIFYKQLAFANCEPPENGEIIKIISGFEDLYASKRDPHNPISVIVVTEYEKINNEEVNQEKAYEKFQKITKENEQGDSLDIPF